MHRRRARLRKNPAALRSVAQRLASRPAGDTTAQMVAAYHALVPLAARAPARFAVGVGRDNALTEPYRHLNEAYVHLSDAYDKVLAAYNHMEQAEGRARTQYEEARREVDALRDSSLERLEALRELHLGTHWWHARRAQQALDAWHEKMRNRTKKDPEKDK